MELHKLLLCFLLVVTYNSRTCVCDEVETDSSITEEVQAESSDVKSPQEQFIVSEASNEQLEQAKEGAQKHEFQAEVYRVMSIIVDSLYSSKEIFLRELISNSYDALDKLRFLSLKEPSVLEQNPDLCIRIKIDPEAKTITVQDSGIGMTEAEMISNLGTIAKSGTKDFIDKLGRIRDENSNNLGAVQGDLSSQIGQFGVGLYSTFLVASRVVIASKCNDDDKQHIWDATPNSFVVYEDPRGNTLKRGTSVTLYLNQEAREFLETRRIVELVKKYSEFVQFPIYIWTNLDHENKETDYHWQHINDVEPIWMRPPSNITEEEYEKFFNFIYYSKEKGRSGKPKGVIHFAAEGESNFRALLFIPDKLPRQFTDNPLEWTPRFSLCVRRIFITGGLNDFLPHYMGYIGGVVDSDDLPLNVGRESLQHNQLIKVIKKKLVRKVLDYIKKMAANNQSQYENFYREFSTTLKFGIMEDTQNMNKLAHLLRFYSSASPEKLISLDDYVSRMKPAQRVIYFITASSVAEARKSPYLEKHLRKGLEVIYMCENIDEGVMRSLTSYEGKDLQHIAKEGNEVITSKTEEELLKEKVAEFEPLTVWLKKSYFKEKVAAVRISNRLVTSACILVASEHGYSGNMDKILRSQAYQGEEYDSVLNQPKNIELNPFHPLVKIMLKQLKEDSDSLDLKTSADICLSLATLIGGYSIQDGLELAKLVERTYLKTHNIDVEEVEKEIRMEQGLDEDDRDDDKVDNSEYDVLSDADDHGFQPNTDPNMIDPNRSQKDESSRPDDASSLHEDL